MTTTSSTRHEDDRLMSIDEVADEIRVSVATLRYWRHQGTGPHGFRVGRVLRYWRTDVHAWLQEQYERETSR